MAFNIIAPSNEHNYGIQLTYQNALDQICKWIWTVLLIVLVSSIHMQLSLLKIWANYVTRKPPQILYLQRKNVHQLFQVQNTEDGIYFTVYATDTQPLRYLHILISVLPWSHLCMVKFRKTQLHLLKEVITLWQWVSLLCINSWAKENILYTDRYTNYLICGFLEFNDTCLWKNLFF